MVDLFGTLAMISSIIYLCFGLPVQIFKNYKRKSTEGLSLFLIIFCASTLLMWSLYAWVKDPKDWYIIASNIPGLIFSIVLLFQFRVYRKSNKVNS